MPNEKKENKKSVLESIVDTFMPMRKTANNISPDARTPEQESERQKALKKLMNDY